MSDYIKATNFATKDSLSTGNPNKIIKGTEIDTEFNAIASAVASKSDINSPTFTGVPAAPTASAATNTTQVATTAFVTAATVAERTAAATLTNKTLTSPTISGGSISGITDLAVADGGTGASTLAANNVLLGNGTSALQTVAPSTAGNLLTSNGTTWTSAAPPSGGVTSAVAGNGVAVSGATGAVTFSVACPTFNTVGSYVFGMQTGTVSTSTPGSGGTIAAGDLSSARGTSEDTGATWSFASVNNLSGTWRNMGAGNPFNPSSDRYMLNLFCRVS